MSAHILLNLYRVSYISAHVSMNLFRVSMSAHVLLNLYGRSCTSAHQQALLNLRRILHESSCIIEFI